MPDAEHVPVTITFSLASRQVAEANAAGFAAGDIVMGWFGWQEWAAVTPDAIIRKVAETQAAAMRLLTSNADLVGAIPVLADTVRNRRMLRK